jgi:hypothetical protein
MAGRSRSRLSNTLRRLHLFGHDEVMPPCWTIPIRNADRGEPRGVVLATVVPSPGHAVAAHPARANENPAGPTSTMALACSRLERRQPRFLLRSGRTGCGNQPCRASQSRGSRRRLLRSHSLHQPPRVRTRFAQSFLRSTGVVAGPGATSGHTRARSKVHKARSRTRSHAASAPVQETKAAVLPPSPHLCTGARPENRGGATGHGWVSCRQPGDATGVRSLAERSSVRGPAACWSALGGKIHSCTAPYDANLLCTR